MSNVAMILPAAGKSTRFGGDQKKPFVALDNRPIWLRTVELFITRPNVVQTLLVIAPEDEEEFRQRYGANLMFLEVEVVTGGAERFQSVANALERVQGEVEYIGIHDAVRPCTPPRLIDTVLAAAMQHGAAIPALPVRDTLKRVDGEGRIAHTLARDGLWQAQTPQIFRTDWIRAAYTRRQALQETITDDAQLVEAIGQPVYIVEGSPTNLKITTPEDLLVAEALLHAGEKNARGPEGRHPFDDEEYL